MPTYRNPPLVEVFCEILFPEDTWDEDKVPSFRSDLGSEYRPPRIVKGVEAKFKLDRRTPDFALKGPPEFRTIRYQFWSESQPHTIVQVGPGILVVNQHGQADVSGWEETYKHRLRNGLALYLKHWPAHQAKGIALHYIDKVEVSAQSFEIEDYFRIFPATPPTVDAIGNWQLRLQTPGLQEHELITISCHQAPEQDENKRAFIWQWDYVRSSPIDVEAESIEKWLDQSHRRIVDIFHSAFTEKLCETWLPIGDEE